MGKGCFCESSSTVFQTELLAVLNCELYKISSGFSWRTLFMVNETAFPFPGNPCSSRRDAAQAGGNAAQEALSLVNQQRTAAGLGALVWNQGLADWYTVNSGLMYGENLAMGYSSASGVVNGWMNSPSHKANIMNGSFKSCGISIIEANGQWHWAQEFGY